MKKCNVCGTSWPAKKSTNCPLCSAYDYEKVVELPVGLGNKEMIIMDKTLQAWYDKIKKHIKKES